MSALSAKTAVAAAAALATVGFSALPASAQSYYAQNYGTGSYSQPYDYNSRYYGDDRSSYDYCRNDRGQRQGAGTFIGGAAGAVAGSQLAARGRRTEGSILGGVVGAVIGNVVGRNSGKNCETYPSNYYDDRAYSAPVYDDRYSDDRYEDRYSDNRYVQVYPAPMSSYGSSYGYGDDYSSRYSTSYGYGNTDRDGCRLAESRIRLPDGRSETRYVRTCPDQSGRYRVVD
ncbi:glycine zipper 2TM domain-containing protein [Brevundimonas sp.]|uniref:glycine zipper 2TM domain-containing protein n=1 Tax=Brevundimonas sp. TaxID=1871086 RepID=UPI003567E9A5